MSPSDGRYTFRKALPADAGLIDAMIAGLAEDIGAPAKKTSKAGDFEGWLSGNPSGFRGLIAEQVGSPVGMCLWFRWFSTWRGQAGIFVQDLYVAPGKRGSGLGKALLSAAIAGERARGVAFIRLGVDVTNEGAVRFYERLGFTRMEGDYMLDLYGAPFDALAESNLPTTDAESMEAS